MFFGPYVFNGHQCISRMVAKKVMLVQKASHILLAYQGAPQSTATRTKEEAQALANSLLAQAKANPGNFAMLAMANSDDPGSKIMVVNTTTLLQDKWFLNLMISFSIMQLELLEL